ncbi:unnamed protein product [Allacma fusca]|uniref:Uncharacterized protein n=1 Tax=Allacma fusca TaxID=39272 RepID=A0A8J2KRY5_9HEXA|nr:unnamed protein product [Allacma fusca]
MLIRMYHRTFFWTHRSPTRSFVVLKILEATTKVRADVPRKERGKRLCFKCYRQNLAVRKINKELSYWKGFNKFALGIDEDRVDRLTKEFKKWH